MPFFGIGMKIDLFQSFLCVFRCISLCTVEELLLFLGSLSFALHSLGTSWEACLTLQVQPWVSAGREAGRGSQAGWVSRWLCLFLQPPQGLGGGWGQWWEKLNVIALLGCKIIFPLPCPPYAAWQKYPFFSYRKERSREDSLIVGLSSFMCKTILWSEISHFLIYCSFIRLKN